MSSRFSYRGIFGKYTVPEHIAKMMFMKNDVRVHPSYSEPVLVFEDGSIYKASKPFNLLQEAPHVR